MADVLHRTTKELRKSVNTPEFSDVQWIVNPDLSAVAGQPVKYWIVEGDNVRLATAGEQVTIDADIAAAEAAAAAAELEANRAKAKALIDAGKDAQSIATRAAMKVVHAGMNEQRGATGQPSKNWPDVVQAAKDIIDAGQADPEG